MMSVIQSTLVADGAATTGAAEPRAGWRQFRPARLYLGLVAGFFLCLTLTDTLLPALGFGDFAHFIEPTLNMLARYIVFGLLFVIVQGIWRTSKPIAAFGLAAAAVLQYFFFDHYNLGLALAGLALVGVAVGLAYRIHAQRQAATPGVTPHDQL